MFEFIMGFVNFSMIVMLFILDMKISAIKSTIDDLHKEKFSKKTGE